MLTWPEKEHSAKPTLFGESGVLQGHILFFLCLLKHRLCFSLQPLSCSGSNEHPLFFVGAKHEESITNYHLINANLKS